MSDPFSLAGRRAAITGGSRGIGGAIASAFASAGAEVSVIARSKAACEAKAAEVGGHALVCDVTDTSALEDAFGDIEARGGVDILVVAAGASHASPAKFVSGSDIESMMAIHLKAAVRAAQLAAEQMRSREEGGAILFVTSVWGLGAQPGTLAYGTAKAALAHAVRVLAVEWARDGIRVNGLAPGFVDTAMTDGLDEGVKDKLLARVPMRRAATPEEMAGPALLLCSDAGSYITGHILVADGGERAR